MCKLPGDWTGQHNSSQVVIRTVRDIFALYFCVLVATPQCNNNCGMCDQSGLQSKQIKHIGGHNCKMSHFAQGDHL